jgi:hypothetical protein
MASALIVTKDGRRVSIRFQSYTITDTHVSAVDVESGQERSIAIEDIAWMEVDARE